jgi:transcriptional regulator with XRE-family HTH domain
MATDAENLGARLRTARTRRGLTQQQLAERVGLSIESISRAERGVITPTIWTLKDLAKALSIPLLDLVEGGPTSTRATMQRGECLDELRELDDATLDTLVSLLRRLRQDGRGRGSSRVRRTER